ncbi:hypothetical protein NE865_14528 [Phthorimaea operculella]|nr:hypothetical protein NE865_14528 [Phthorimaea operculella]
MSNDKLNNDSSTPRPSEVTKQLLRQCLDVVKKSSEAELTLDEMREALTKIALELQKFQNDTTDDSSVGADTTLYATKLKMKKKQIRSLKENLNTACMVAKTLTTSKQKEQNSINEHLNASRAEVASLQKKNAELAELIQKQNTEKQVLNSKFQHLKSFIELGYKELQGMRNKPIEDLTVELQLKEIIVCCGQYYADFHNEHDKCIQLEQKNRFLGNKLSILERHLDEVTTELRRYQDRRRSKTKENKDKDSGCQISCVRSEYSLSRDINVSNVAIEPITELHSFRSSQFSRDSDSGIDLSSHLSLVHELLKDQDCMLSELKNLSDEIQRL